MKKHKAVLNLALLLCAYSMLLTPSIVQAADNRDTWKTAASIYLWGAGINGSTQNGSDLDVGFDDIIKELDFALMGTLESRKGNWSYVGDIVYLDISADESATLPNATVKADLSLEGLAVTLLGGYNINNSGENTTDFIFGARYFNVDTSINLGINNNAGREQSVSEDVIDAVIGVRGQLGLNEKWFMPYYLDIGTGQSESTMQVLGGIGYKYTWGELKLVYRYLAWNLDSDSLLSDINFNGPVFGATFHF